MITGKISQLKDRNGNVSFPVTTEKAIYMEDGQTTLKQHIDEVDSQLVGKVAFLEDDSSNIEIPMVDEKLELINEQYNDIATNKIPQLQGQLDNIKLSTLSNMVDVVPVDKKEGHIYLTSVDDNFIINKEKCVDKRVENLSNKILRVATFNTKEMVQMDNRLTTKIQNTINKSFANVCAMQENIDGYKYKFNEKLCSNLFPFFNFGKTVLNYADKRVSYGIGTISELDVTGKTTTLFNMNNTGLEQRAVTKSVINYNGKMVSIYNTHLSTNDTQRASEISQLLSLVNSDTSLYKIVCGDLNLTAKAELNGFTSSGYKLCNNGKFITVKGQHIYGAIDEIIVSGNIGIVKSDMVLSGEESDHHLFYTDLTII